MYHGLEGVWYHCSLGIFFVGVAVICLIMNKMQDITAALEFMCLRAAVTCMIIYKL